MIFYKNTFISKRLFNILNKKAQLEYYLYLRIYDVQDNIFIFPANMSSAELNILRLYLQLTILKDEIKIITLNYYIKLIFTTKDSLKYFMKVFSNNIYFYINNFLNSHRIKLIFTTDIPDFYLIDIQNII